MVQRFETGNIWIHFLIIRVFTQPSLVLCISSYSFFSFSFFSNQLFSHCMYLLLIHIASVEKTGAPAHPIALCVELFPIIGSPIIAFIGSFTCFALTSLISLIRNCEPRIKPRTHLNVLTFIASLRWLSRCWNTSRENGPRQNLTRLTNAFENKTMETVLDTIWWETSFIVVEEDEALVFLLRLDHQEY